MVRCARRVGNARAVPTSDLARLGNGRLPRQPRGKGPDGEPNAWAPSSQHRGSGSSEATHDRYELGDRPTSAESPAGDFEADEDRGDQREGTVEDVAPPRGAETRGIGWK
jgi:hypothetical protein